MAANLSYDLPPVYASEMGGGARVYVGNGGTAVLLRAIAIRVSNLHGRRKC